MDERENMDIDFRKLAATLLRGWWILLLTAILFAAGAYLVTRYAMTPQYSASIKLFVNNSTVEGATAVGTGDIAASRSLVQTYIMIVRSETVLDEVIDRADLWYSTRQLNSIISAGAMEGTEVFHVTVTDPSPVRAQRIANAIADIAPAHLSEIVEGSSLRIVDRAKLPTSPSSPDYNRNVMVGALAGLFLSGMVLVLLMILDTRISSESDLGEISELPVLGVISDFQSAGKSKYGDYYASDPSN